MKTKAQETQNRKKKGGLRRLLKILVAGVSVYLVVTLVSGQMQVAAKQKELNELAVQVEQQAEQNKELTRLMETGDEDAYIERIAREKLRYARPDERIFIDISGQ